jgi:hypothetical protein
LHRENNSSKRCVHIRTRGPRGPWIEYLRKGQKVKVESLFTSEKMAKIKISEKIWILQYIKGKSMTA